MEDGRARGVGGGVVVGRRGEGGIVGVDFVGIEDSWVVEGMDCFGFVVGIEDLGSVAGRVAFVVVVVVAGIEDVVAFVRIADSDFERMVGFEGDSERNVVEAVGVEGQVEEYSDSSLTVHAKAHVPNEETVYVVGSNQVTEHAA